MLGLRDYEEQRMMEIYEARGKRHSKFWMVQIEGVYEESEYYKNVHEARSGGMSNTFEYYNAVWEKYSQC